MSQTVVSSGTSSSGLSPGAGDMVIVLQGGTVTATDIGSGGFLDLAGTADGTTVSGGGTLFLDGGLASGTVIEGGAAVRASDGTMENTIVESGGVLVAAGALVTDVGIASGGVAVVTAGATADEVSVRSGATLLLEGGEASGAIVDDGGYVVELDGGSLAGAMVQTGADIIATGVVLLGPTGAVTAPPATSVSLMTMESGLSAYVLAGGTFAGSLVMGGTVVVESGGTASGNVLLSGTDDVAAAEFVSAGGVAIGEVLEQGATLSVVGGTAEVVSVGAGATLDLQEGTASGAQVTMGGVVSVGLGATATATKVDSGGVLVDSGEADATIVSGGSLVLSGGVASGTVVEHGGDVVLGAGTITGTTLDLGAQLTFEAAGVTTASATLDANDLLTVTSGGTVLRSAALAGDYTGEYFATSVEDGVVTVTVEGGTPCFCAGTLIETGRGEVAVEDLRIGELVRTASGALVPIRWIGRRAYDGRFAARNPDVLPVTFRAGALGDGLPRRDLSVSPLHAMFLEGHLVPASALVNGVSIVQARVVDRVDYVHVELDRHDVLLAEGAPSESFVDDASRGMFHNAAEFHALYPDARPSRARFCAPLLTGGPVLEALRRRLQVPSSSAVTRADTIL